MNKTLSIFVDISQDEMNLGVSFLIKKIPMSNEIKAARKVVAANPLIMLITSTVQKFEDQLALVGVPDTWP